jgi:transglutaminase-like putative cysteine protease
MTLVSSRRLLGVLFLWALLPFPFLYIIMPPFWLAAAGVALFLCLRPSSKLRPSSLVLNLLGVVILAAVVLAGGIRVGPLRPLGHLLLLLTSVRALAVADRRSFLRAVLLVFLVWVVALTSSTHVIVALYFAASAVLWWWVGMAVHLAGLGFEPMVTGGLPRPRHVVVAAMVALVLSIPIFLLLPRLQSPWIAGRGGVSSVTGFTSHVDLAGVGTIRQSHQVAMTVRSLSGESIRSEWMRMRATALQRVTLNSWAPRGAYEVLDSAAGPIRLHGDASRLVDAVELEIELVRPRRYLFLPQGTIALASPVEVNMDPAGGVALTSRVRGPLVYRVWVTRGDPPTANDPPLENPPRFELDPEVSALATRIVAGLESNAARAAAVESYLSQNYGYSLIGMSQQRADPVSWFLLHERQGHCEYFAGAMVALLDDVGVPSRMVAGYSGGNLSLDGVEAVIRQANAHTWVEAWVGGGRWSVFDPTPVGDIPALSRPSGRERLRWAVDWVQSAWDRYVLTFGFGEQVGLMTAVANGIDSVLRSVQWQRLPWVVVSVAIPILVWWMVKRRRAHEARSKRVATGPAAATVDRIAIRLAQNGVEVPTHATVRWISNKARQAWPAAGLAVAELAWLAERELYTPEGQNASRRAAVRGLWKQARQAMRSSHGQRQGQRTAAATGDRGSDRASGQHH